MYLLQAGSMSSTIFGFRDLLETNALDYIQFDTNRVGGISQARKEISRRLQSHSRFRWSPMRARCITIMS